MRDSLGNYPESSQSFPSHTLHSFKIKHLSIQINSFLKTGKVHSLPLNDGGKELSYYNKQYFKTLYVSLSMYSVECLVKRTAYSDD